jgi:cysteine desulfurase
MIDLDANATTSLLPEAFEAMRPIWLDVPGNPSSAHAIGRKARQHLDSARERIAACLDAKIEEIVLTSGATEANNLAIFGLVGSSKSNHSEPLVNSTKTAISQNVNVQPIAMPHLVTSQIEHPCVIEPFKYLEKQGYNVTRISPSADGKILTELVRTAINENKSVSLASIMLANHETGAINEIAAMTANLPKNCYFHCDAAQAVGKIPVSFRKLNVTALTASAHKFRGPKGIGFLVIKQGVKLKPVIHGGPQQSGQRPGTESVALAIGAAVALEHAVKRLEQTKNHWRTLKTKLWQALADIAQINGPKIDDESSLTNTINLSFAGCRADVLLMALDMAGVACSTGSACASGALQTSPVLAAMGIEGDRLRSAIRLSFSPTITEEQIDSAIATIRNCARK